MGADRGRRSWSSARPRCDRAPRAAGRALPRPRPGHRRHEREPRQATRRECVVADCSLGQASLARMPRPRLLVLNQYYWPGVEATAQLLTELCEALAEDIDVKVVTGILHGHEDEPRRLVHNGVEIVRVPSTSFERSKLFARGANYVTYLGNALFRGLRGPRPDVVLCMTDPPIVADIALLVARRYRAPLVVISQDVFPEIAVELKRLENPVVMCASARSRLALPAAGRPYRRDRRHDAATAARRKARRRIVCGSFRTGSTRSGSGRLSKTTAGRSKRGYRRQVRRHALGQRRPRAGSRLARPRRRRSCAISTTCAIMIIGMGARHAELVALAELLEVDQVTVPYYQPRSRAAAVAVRRRRARRRARVRPRGLRRPEPPLRDPRRRAGR